MPKKLTVICCIKCKREFANNNLTVHYERMHGTKEQKEKYSSGYNNQYHTEEYKKKCNKGRNRSLDLRFGPFTDFKVSCHKCNTQFTVTEREKKFPKKEKYFCSRSCANSKPASEKRKEKVRQKLKKIRNIFKICPTCNEEFKLEGNSQKRFCSKDCRNKRFRKGLDSNKLNKLDYRDYRSKCDFTFNLKDFEDDFDFSLIQEHGWYSPSNKGNNLTRYKQRSYGKCEIWI